MAIYPRRRTPGAPPPYNDPSVLSPLQGDPTSAGDQPDDPMGEPGVDGPYSSAPPTPTSLPPRAPTGGPSAPPPVDAGVVATPPRPGSTLPKLSLPESDRLAELQRMGPGKPGLARKILAGVGAVGTGLASTYRQTAPSAAQLQATRSGIQDLLHPGQPGFGPGAYSAQLARQSALAANERQDTQLAMTEQQHQIENRRADAQVAQQGMMLEQQRQNLHRSYQLARNGEIVDSSDARLNDPKIFSGVEPYIGPGGKQYLFARYAPGYVAGEEGTARAEATQKAMSIWVTPKTAEQFQIPTVGLKQDDQGNFLVPQRLVTPGLRAAVSPANRATDRQMMQSFVDDQARLEGKSAGGMLGSLSPAGQARARHEYISKSGKTPEMSAQMWQEEMADKATQRAATAAGNFVPVAGLPPIPGRAPTGATAPAGPPAGSPPPTPTVPIPGQSTLPTTPPTAPRRPVVTPPATPPAPPADASAAADPYGDALWKGFVQPSAPKAGVKPFGSDLLDSNISAINRDPFAINNIKDAKLLSRIQSRMSDLGLPIPTNTNDAQLRTQLRAADMIDVSSEKIANLVRSDPKAVGVAAGRVGPLESWIGHELVTSGPTANIEAQLRTHMNALLGQEVRNVAGTRPAVQMMEMFKKVSAQPQQTGAILDGTLEAQHNQAQITRKAALDSIYKAGGLRNYRDPLSPPKPTAPAAKTVSREQIQRYADERKITYDQAAAAARAANYTIK